MNSNWSWSRRIERAELWPLVLSLPITLACVAVLRFAASPSLELEQASLRIDGSSTALPLVSNLAARFQSQHEHAARIAITARGSSSGIERLLANDLDLCVAARPMSQAECDALKSQGRSVIELPLALDGVVLGLSAENNFVDRLSGAELARILRAEDPARRWSELRPGWPELEIAIYAPGPSTGTWEIFSKAFATTELGLRQDLRFQEEDEVRADVVGATRGALGVFSLAQIRTHSNELRPIRVEPGDLEPLSRLLGRQRAITFYVDIKRLEAKALLEAFLQFALSEVDALAAGQGFTPLSADAMRANRRRLAERCEMLQADATGFETPGSAPTAEAGQ